MFRNFKNEFGNGGNKMSNLKESVFAGGCFWCMEAPFVLTEGVETVKSGYTGGEKAYPTYEEVCTGATGHFEAIKIWYDPQKLDYAKLLWVFFQSIDPTDPYGQFADKGSQYEGAVFYNNEDERKTAEKFIDLLDKSGIFEKKISVKLLPASEFFEAEEYHQEYYKKNKTHYKAYRQGSGRGPFLEKIWNDTNKSILDDILQKVRQ